MQLGLTIPLQRHLKIKTLLYGEPLDRRYCWDLHVIELHGRKSLLAVNCSSRYLFNLFDMSLSDWEELPARFLTGLRQSLADAEIPEEAIERYLKASGEAQLCKTHGRREVAFLNRAWDDTAALDFAVSPSRQEQPLLDGTANLLPRRCAGYDGLGCALERLRLDLELAPSANKKRV